MAIMNFLVNKQTYAMNQYPSDGLYDSNMYALLETPNGIAPGNCKVLDTAGVLSLIEMTDKQNTNPMWSQLRAERNAKLAVCDFTQLPDYQGGNAAAYATYRQALRDTPQNTADPQSVSWATQP